MTPQPPTDAQIIAWALLMLHGGVLVRVLPTLLMEEFGLTQKRAAELSIEALKQHLEARGQNGLE